MLFTDGNQYFMIDGYFWTTVIEYFVLQNGLLTLWLLYLKCVMLALLCVHYIYVAAILSLYYLNDQGT